MLVGGLYGVFALVFGLMTVGVTLLYRRYEKSRVATICWLALATLWLLILVRTNQLVAAPKLWLLTIPLAPLADKVLSGIQWCAEFSRPLLLDEQVQDQEHWLRRRQERREARKVVRVLRRGLPQSSAGQPWLTLGVRYHGDRLPGRFHLREKNGWLQLDETALDRHLFILGATGSGKSETIKRLAEEILTHTERNLYFVDGKGDSELAQTIRALCHEHGRGTAPIFRLGTEQRGALYDGFRGNSDVIYNRVLAAIRVQESQGNALYHANRNRTVLGFAVNTSTPPRSFPELLERLDERWLVNAHTDDPLVQKRIAKLAADGAIESLDYHLYPFYQQFKSLIHPSGFGLEDVRSAIFSIRTQSVGDTAKQFLNFLLEDFKDFVGNRQNRPGVLILDEFGQFDNDTIVSLMTMARSARMAIVLATQDLATLKDLRTTQIILANSLTKIIMRTDRPEEMVSFAGTVYQAETSTHIVEGDLGDDGSVRLQHAFKVPPNEVPKLRPGQAFVVSQRYASKMYLPQIERSSFEIPDQEPEFPVTTEPVVQNRPKPQVSFESGTEAF